MTFSSNSLPKLILLSDRPDDIELKNTVCDEDWFAKEFDVFRTSSVKEAYDVLMQYRDAVSGIITQNEQRLDTYPELSKLPEWMHRRWYHYSDYENHADEIYECITHNELSGWATPKFSFVTPLYKTNPEYFRILYVSLAQQTINDWEWVLLDDSPEPLEWVKEFVDKDIRLKYFRIGPTNGNIGLAKYRANCMSTGQWLLELDHDDYLPWWCLDILNKAIIEFPCCGFMYSDTLDIDGNGDQIINQYGKEFAFGFCNPYMCQDPTMTQRLYPNDTAEINSATIRHIVGVPNHLRAWRRDVYFKILGHNQTQRIADDYELIVRTFLETEMCHIKYPCYYQRFDGGNSQDAAGGVNRADIQRRVWAIANHYNSVIHNRMCELADEPRWDPESADFTIQLYPPSSDPVWVNKIYIPSF